MRGTSVGVITNFQTPPNPPDAVAEAQEEFDRIANEWARLQGEVQDAEAAVEAARAEDTRVVAAAFGNGETVEDATAHEREAQAKVAALRSLIAGAEVAVDRAGDALLGPIEDARATWMTELEAEHIEATEEYDSAVAQAREALARLGRARSAITWLEQFDAAEARAGLVVGYHGKAQPVTAETLRGERRDVRDLLALAAEATAPEPLAYGDPRRAEAVTT